VSYFKKKSAREESKQISEGKKEPHHIGKYSIEMIDQELFSLGNTKPMFRDPKWHKRIISVREAIQKRLSKNENSIICQLQFNTLERIENQR